MSIGNTLTGAVPVLAGLVATNQTTVSAVLADIAGLSVALVANAVYLFEAELSVASSDVNGNTYGVQFSAAGASVEAHAIGTLLAATTQSARIAALNTATAVYLTVAADGGLSIAGTLTTGANAGNLTIQHAKSTAGTATAYAKSSLSAVRVA